MATTVETGPIRESPRRLQHNQDATAVGTDMATFDVRGVKRLFVHLTVAVADLTSFAIKARSHPSATAVTLFSTSGHYTAPSGRLKGVSADLTALAVGAGWFDLETEGLDQVFITAGSGGSATVAFKAGGW